MVQPSNYTSVKWTPLLKHYYANRLPYELARMNVLAKLDGRVLTREVLATIEQRTSLYVDFLRDVCLRAKQRLLSFEQSEQIESTKKKRTAVSVPLSPMWIELAKPLTTHLGSISGLFCYDPEQQFLIWKSQNSRENLLYKAVESRILNERGWLVLEAIDQHGHTLIDIRFHPTRNQWKLSYPHVCAMTCTYIEVQANPPYALQPCIICSLTLDRISSWFYKFYTTGIINTLPAPIIQPQEKSPSKKKKSKLPNELKSSKTQRPPRPRLIIEPATHFYTSFPEPIPPKPRADRSFPQSQHGVNPIYIAQHPLLVDHYIERSGKAETITKSHKYLWMQTAWLMSEVLRQTTDGTLLQLPAQDVYVELEQSRQLYGQTVAAFSFIRTEQSSWRLSVLGDTGQTIWVAFYEQNTWTLPKGYICPKQQCKIEVTTQGRVYELCDYCQKCITHYTSWIAIALRMIAGDFQEQVQMQEPEYISEISARRAGEGKAIVHRYRVIRYVDACKYIGKEFQSKKGSWMLGRPLAESEYEVNPNAIIYVKIYPKEHDRTYHHDRYVNMRGKTQHIESKPRVQPMTIATFKQLKSTAHITRVYASKFD